MALIADSLFKSPAVTAAIDTLVAEAQAASAQLTEVRPADPALAASYDEIIDRAGATRGRPLLYRYMASGVGNGALVELADGSVRYDLITGIGTYFFGHSDPESLRVSLEAALSDVVKHGNLQTGPEPTLFSEVLLTEAARASRLKHAFLATSGAMANENALKICFQKRPGSSRVIAFEHCFMGRSIVMSQIGDKAGNRVGIPLTVLVDYMPYWDPVRAAAMGPGDEGKRAFIAMAVAQLTTYLDRYPDQHAAFCMELVQGEGGFVQGDRDFLKALMEVCRERGVPVFDDEVQAFGRTESMFAYEALGLGDYIDVLTLGKMAQACATLYTPEMAPKPGLLSGTFVGETGSFRVGQSMLERLRDGGYYGPEGKIAAHHRAFRAQVDALAKRRPEWFPECPAADGLAGGVGGMMRFTPFGGDNAKVIAAAKACFDEGAILFWCGHGPMHLRMLPPIPAMDLDEWPAIFAVIERGLARVAG